MIETVNIFPTTISAKVRDVTEQEKDTWYECIMDGAKEECVSIVDFGFDRLQQDPRLAGIFSEITSLAYHHLETLGMDTDGLDIHVVKSWVNALSTSVNPRHHHAEAHYSFTYYPNVPNDVTRFDLCFDRIGSNLNEPYPHFISANARDPLAPGGDVVRIKVEEGLMLIFPANLYHFTDAEGLIQLQSEFINSKDDLRTKRVCIAGDMLVARKSAIGYSRLLPPPNEWRAFPRTPKS